MDNSEPRKFEEPDPALDKIAHDVIGAAIQVHRVLGPGFLESVYHAALIHELRKRGLKVDPEWKFVIEYDGVIVGSGDIDLLVNDRLVLELKAVERLAAIHEAQIIHYLKAGHFKLGLLLNFHERRMADGIKRVIWSE